VAEERLAVGWVPDQVDALKDGVVPTDQVAGVGVRVAEAEYGGQVLLAAGVDAARAREEEEEEQEWRYRRGKKPHGWAGRLRFGTHARMALAFC